MGRNNKNLGFNEKVWQLCSRIPKGRVSTYKIIAEKLGTKAYRAVGNALNKNPYWPKVPCHRVVGSDGGLSGFAFGLGRKEELLQKEGIKIQNGCVLQLEKVLFKF
jgi:methylated-DNA-[protein]-cysteine S-methyltransferase